MIAAIFATVLFALSWLRHHNFWSGFDLAIFDQASWQLSRGSDFVSIMDRRVLADHVSPVLYLFAPLYRIVATPLWLLGAQAAALGARVVPVRALARHLGASVPLATFLTLASAPILAAGLFDFHASTLAVPFVAAALYWGVADRPGLAGLAGAIVVLCRADLALAVAAAALLASRRSRLPLAVIAGVGAVASVGVPSLFGAEERWSSYYAHLGSSPADVLMNPWRVVGHLVGQPAMTLVVWALAGGFLVGVRLRWLIALCLAGLPVLLSNWKGNHLPWFHYGAPVAPFAIGGTLAALAGAEAQVRWVVDRLRVAVVAVPALMLVAASPLAPGAPPRHRLWSTVRPNAAADFRMLLQELDGDGVLSVEQPLLPHLSQRPTLFLYPTPFREAPELFRPGLGPEIGPVNSDRVVAVATPRRLLDDAVLDEFEVTSESGEYVLLRRRATP